MELWGTVRDQLVSLQWGASIAELGGFDTGVSVWPQRA